MLGWTIIVAEVELATTADELAVCAQGLVEFGYDTFDFGWKRSVSPTVKPDNSMLCCDWPFASLVTLAVLTVDCSKACGSFSHAKGVAPPVSTVA